jgi:branched-chain amino acid transport system ATP-binding protein
VIVQELLAALQRITRDEGIAAIIVEQHPQAILAMSHSAVVLDHGNVVHSGDAKALLADDALLNRLIGVLA